MLLHRRFCHCPSYTFFLNTTACPLSPCSEAVQALCVTPKTQPSTPQNSIAPPIESAIPTPYHGLHWTATQGDSIHVRNHHSISIATFPLALLPPPSFFPSSFPSSFPIDPRSFSPIPATRIPSDGVHDRRTRWKTVTTTAALGRPTVANPLPTMIPPKSLRRKGRGRGKRLICMAT